MFREDDIVVQIGHSQKWRILVVQLKSMTYRVSSVNGVGHCTTTFDKEWVDRDFVKVGEYAWYGEIQEKDDD